MSSAQSDPRTTRGGGKGGGILAKIRSVSYTLIPLNELRDLPAKKGLGIIAAFYAVLMLTLLFLVVNGYLLHKDDRYLTLQKEQYAGFGTCEDVPRLLDGRFVADSNGNWDVSQHYKHSLGTYDLKFTKFEGE
jgi:hypothetical protein